MGLLLNIHNIYILPVGFEVFLTLSRCRGDLQLGGDWYPLACFLSCVYTKCQYMCSMHKMYMCVHACVLGWQNWDKLCTYEGW